MVVVIPSGLSSAQFPLSSPLALYFPLFACPCALNLALPKPRGSSVHGGMGEECWATLPTSHSRLWQLTSYSPLVPLCKATINLNFICLAKAKLMGTFAEAQERRLPVTVALGPAVFPLVLAELRGLFPARSRGVSRRPRRPHCFPGGKPPNKTQFTRQIQ